MKAILFLGGLLCCINIGMTQNRIEVLVNDQVQKVSSEPIYVTNRNGKIEIRIYYTEPKDSRILVDSVKTVECGTKTTLKNKSVLKPPPQQQIQLYMVTQKGDM